MRKHYDDQLAEFECASNMAGATRAQCQRFLGGVSVKLEPMSVILPREPVLQTVGFELLAFSLATGKSFGGIVQDAAAAGVSGELCRFWVMLKAFESIDVLKKIWQQKLGSSVDAMCFTVNLDDVLLDSPHLYRFIDRFYNRNIAASTLFEINEHCSVAQVAKIQTLITTHGIRAAIDDGDKMQSEVRRDLASHVEMGKLDAFTTLRLLSDGYANPAATIDEIARHRLGGKPYVIEGVENDMYLRFLQANWTAGGKVIAQGYGIAPSSPFDEALVPVERFGGHGGYVPAYVVQDCGRRRIGGQIHG